MVLASAPEASSAAAVSAVCVRGSEYTVCVLNPCMCPYVSEWRHWLFVCVLSVCTRICVCVDRACGMYTAVGCSVGGSVGAAVRGPSWSHTTGPAKRAVCKPDRFVSSMVHCDACMGMYTCARSCTNTCACPCMCPCMCACMCGHASMCAGVPSEKGAAVMSVYVTGPPGSGCHSCGCSVGTGVGTRVGLDTNARTVQDPAPPQPTPPGMQRHGTDASTARTMRSEEE